MDESPTAVSAVPVPGVPVLALFSPPPEMTKAAGIAYGSDEALRHIMADETSVVVPDGQRGVIQGC